MMVGSFLSSSLGKILAIAQSFPPSKQVILLLFNSTLSLSEAVIFTTLARHFATEHRIIKSYSKSSINYLFPNMLCEYSILAAVFPYPLPAQFDSRIFKGLKFQVFL